MKILLFNQYFWPENFYINQIAIGLSGLGHEVEVLTGQPNYPDGKIYQNYSAFSLSQETWNGIKINRFPIIPRGKKTPVKLFLNYLSYIISGLIFSSILMRRKKFDLIFVYAPSPIFQVIPSIFLGRIKKIPVVLWVQDLWPESAIATGYIKAGFFARIVKLLVGFCYSKVDLILVQSNAFVQPVLTLAPHKKVIYYPNSVEKTFYSPDDLAIPDIPSLNSAFSVVFAGNVGIAQSMETIVSAAEKLSSYKEIKIVILGAGSKIDWIHKEIKNRKLNNVFIEGSYARETMPLLLRKASILLVSLTDQLIFSLTVPNKIQAYLAVGRPIVASLNGEGAKLIEEAGAGFAAPAENPEKLAEAILKVYLMTNDERDKLGKNGRDFFRKNFDQDQLLKDLINHFNDVIEGI